MADIEQQARDLQRVRAAHPNNPAGSLATVKPPRDLRTKVSTVAEIPEVVMRVRPVRRARDRVDEIYLVAIGGAA